MTTLELLTLTASDRARATLVAIPGIMESAAAMRPTLQHWADRGFDVLAINPRGHGKSARWTEALLARHPGDVIVEDILAAIADIGLRQDVPLVVFGHSAGGGAGAAVAVQLADRVSALVLEDPFWRLPVTPLQDTDVARAAGSALWRIKAMPPDQRIADILRRHPDWPDDELQAWSTAKDDMDISLVENGHVIPSLGWPTLVADLAAAGVPIKIITGTIRTGMTANHRAILRSLGVDVTIVRGATHFIRRDDRDRFHALVDEFLDQHVPQHEPRALEPQIIASS